MSTDTKEKKELQADMDRQPEDRLKEPGEEGSRGAGSLPWAVMTGALVIVVAILGGLFYQCYQTVEKLNGRIEKLTDTVNEVVQATNELGLVQAAAAKTGQDQASEEKTGEKAVQSTQEAAKEETQAAKSTEKENLELLKEQVQAQVDDLSSSNGTWSVYVKRLDSGDAFSINNGKMEAASLIKLYIMGAVYERYGKIQEAGTSKEEIDSLLKAMITVSDNSAANKLIAKLGGGDAQEGMKLVNTFCQVHQYGDTSMERMLEQTNTEKDNYTSVADCGKFLSDIYEGRLEESEEMVGLLKQQERREKIPKGVPQGVVVANKTGELLQIENDAAIVYGDQVPYIFCVITAQLQDADTARTAIAQLSGNIYGYFNQSLESALDKLGQ